VCNDFGNHIPYSDYLAAFSQTRIPVRWPNAAANLEPREDIWPTDKAPVIRRLEDGTNEFSEIRWGFPPDPTQLLDDPSADDGIRTQIGQRKDGRSKAEASLHERALSPRGLASRSAVRALHLILAIPPFGYGQ
jgi:putative SOS response-associated peptidase YedK